MTNSQLSTTEPKKKKKPKQTTRTGTESQKWKSHGRLLVGRGRGENEGNGTGSKKHEWQVQNRQGEVKNSIGNGEAKKLICTTHRRELSGEECWGEGGAGGGEQRGEINGTTVIA